MSSKKKNKLLERDARRVKAVNARLNKIYQLSKLIQNEAELNRFLEDIPDLEVRAETKKLIEPFCLFKVGQVELADAPADPTNVVPFSRGSEAVN